MGTSFCPTAEGVFLFMFQSETMKCTDNCHPIRILSNLNYCETNILISCLGGGGWGAEDVAEWARHHILLKDRNGKLTKMLFKFIHAETTFFDPKTNIFKY